MVVSHITWMLLVVYLWLLVEERLVGATPRHLLEVGDVSLDFRFHISQIPWQ